MWTARTCSMAFLACTIWGDDLALANDETAASFPRVSGNVTTRLGFNGDYDAADPRDEGYDVFLQVIASPILNLSKKWKLKSELRVETVRPFNGARFFEDEGLFARKLFLEYSPTQRLSFSAGKMTPSFALASLVTPGMFGNSYSKEIELIDRIGLGAAYRFTPDKLGEHTLSVSTFFEDTSVFSNSVGSDRGRNQLLDGGASNTETFESFAVSLEGKKIPRLPGLTYKLGYLHQAAGVDGVANENGFTASFLYTRKTKKQKTWSFIGEFAAFQNFEGTDDDIIYASAGIVYKTGAWTGVLSGTARPRGLADGSRFNDLTFQASVEYNFGKGVSLAIAHEFNRDQNVNNNRLGIRLSKSFNLGR